MEQNKQHQGRHAGPRKRCTAPTGTQPAPRHRRVASAVAAGVLASTLMAPAAAFAAVGGSDMTYPNASVTIANTAANPQPNTYKAYKIFNALIDASDNATYIEWASESVKSCVMGFLNTGTNYASWLTANGYTDGALPQVAAEYIAQAINTGSFDSAFNSGANAGANHYPSPSGDSFATQLAQAVGSSSAPASTATAGSAFTGTEGFYLFVSAMGNVGTNEAATAPIWVPLGGTATTIVEKNALPTLAKTVREDRDGTWGKIADANKGQEVAFKLTATMPANIGSFESYAMTFEDTLSAAIVPQGANTSSIVVKVYPTGLSGTATTIPVSNSHLSETYAGNKITVAIDDVKQLGQTISKDTVVTVEYNAHLTDAAAEGATGNPTSATLTYTADPVSLGSKTSTASQAALAAYQIDITKVDKQTDMALQGVGFKVRVAASDGAADTASAGNYISAGGSLVSASGATIFITDAQGKVTIPMLDAGTYVLEEVTAPSAYEKRPDIKLLVTSTLDQAGMKVATLAVTPTTTDNTALSSDIVTSATANAGTGVVAVKTSDDKKVTMPITGMDGITASIVYGGGAIALGLAGWLLTRRRRSAGDGADIGDGDEAA